MSRRLHVYLLPELLDPEALQGGVAVVIDVLRASTTIIAALAAGAAAVVPVVDVDDAQRLSRENPHDPPLLGGERGGMKIPNFHLGNSPSEYSSESVKSRTIVFTTTNGTKALLRAERAHRVLVGAFVNVSAVAHALLSQSAPVHLVCAGTDGQVTLEDVLFAGELTRRLTGSFELDDSARIAVSLAETHRSPQAIHTVLKESLGGANLRALGLDADIEFAASLDRFSIVPELSPDDWRIVLPPPH